MEAAITDSSVSGPEFEKANVTLADPATKRQMCLHLYCKLLPWRIVRNCVAPVKLRWPTDDQPEGLPVLVVEPTDRNRTDWSTARESSVHALLRLLHPFKATGRVSYLYPPQLFMRENFYCYDLFFYSRPLFDATGGRTPLWWCCPRVSEQRFGLKPLGLLLTTDWSRVQFVPEPPIDPALWAAAQEMALASPAVQPLVGPEKEPPSDEQDQPLRTRTEPVFVRLCTGEDEELVHKIRRALSESGDWRIEREFRVPVLGDTEAQWVFLVARVDQ
jgi:hypothetical protein